MTQAEQRAAAKRFADFWRGKGYEKGESQQFWTSLLRDVFGVEHPEEIIHYESKVKLSHDSFIDGHISSTHVLIEQKSIGKSLDQKIRQADGSFLTPFQQAKRYAAELPYSQRPRWIVTSNFQSFYIYDMEKPGGDPEIIHLKDLPTEYYRLQFLVDSGSITIQKETKVSIQAGEIIGLIYDALLKQYKDPENPETLRHLNILCVRLVFCLYAEDAGIFGKKRMFYDYLHTYRAKNVRMALIELFKVLDTKPEDRDPYMDDDLAAFPYVNGGLFAEENIVIPKLDEEIVDLILQKASIEFDWSQISPTIFGAVFESTLNPEKRRSGGMHYTSIENIHKVIDPLFLDDLHEELEQIEALQVIRTKKQKLNDFQKKLASLKFLDPACGSGNFLTETYISLRRLENRVIQDRIELERGQMAGQITFGDLGDQSPIKVGIDQFFGIEINDFAVTVGKTALWIAESQMMQETEDIVHMSLDFLPLKTNATIIEGNALRIDWNDVCPAAGLDYIMGNPPFVGRRYRSKEQTKDISKFFDYKDIDYVACWYKKAAMFMENTSIKTAFVSTNSICQGEQAGVLWSELYNTFHISINFAYQTFIWDSEASATAHVHCVIVGFSRINDKTKKLYSQNSRMQIVSRINEYLLNAPNIFLRVRSTPISSVPEMRNGNVPLDGDALKIEASDYPSFADCKFVKKLVGGIELLRNKKRYVLWLVDATPKDIQNDPRIKKRVELCRERRLAMKDKSSQRLAYTPTTFRDTFNPSDYIAMPTVSSGRRRYLPMAYLHGDTIPTNQVQIIPYASLYHFGILESNVHMAWMRTVAGRLKSDFRYSKDIVYNNFPWPEITINQKDIIEKTAQGILDARALYPDSSLADLYDPLTMPPELITAHQKNDMAVMRLYGFQKTDEDGKKHWFTEEECVAALMRMYQEKVAELNSK